MSAARVDQSRNTGSHQPAAAVTGRPAAACPPALASHARSGAPAAAIYQLVRAARLPRVVVTWATVPAAKSRVR